MDAKSFSFDSQDIKKSEVEEIETPDENDDEMEEGNRKGVITGTKEMYWLNDPELIKDNKSKTTMIENYEIKVENLINVNQNLEIENENLLEAYEILNEETRTKTNDNHHVQMVDSDIDMNKQRIFELEQKILHEQEKYIQLKQAQDQENESQQQLAKANKENERLKSLLMKQTNAGDSFFVKKRKW